METTIPWDFVPLGYGFLTARYLIVAGLFALVFYAWRRDRRQPVKIQPRWPRAADYRREIGYSMLTFAVFVGVGLLTHRGLLSPWSRLYGDVGEHGWLWFWVSFAIVMLFHDAYFYWMHRTIHSRSLYRRVHLVHHRSTNPTPWAAFAFHPFEAALEALGIVLVPFFLPVHVGVLGLAMLVMTVYNAYGHLGFELYPRGFAAHPIGRWINTSVSHNQHHAEAKTNYGLYFLWWDRWFGTIHPDYEGAFEQVAARRAGERVDPEEAAPAAA